MLLDEQVKSHSKSCYCRTTLLMRTLVISRFDHCNSLFYTISGSPLNKLQKIKKNRVVSRTHQLNTSHLFYYPCIGRRPSTGSTSRYSFLHITASLKHQHLNTSCSKQRTLVCGQFQLDQNQYGTESIRCSNSLEHSPTFNQGNSIRSIIQNNSQIAF